MCIVLLSWQPARRPALVVAANRDEFHARPAEPARWRGEIFCGLDLVAGGTWLGVTRGGRFAAVTNFREPVAGRESGARSRGELPMAFLRDGESAEAFVQHIAREQDAYGPFNLLVGDGDALWQLSNRSGVVGPVTPGVHGLSNGRLDEPWPKVEQGRARLGELLSRGVDEGALLSLLRDDTCPPDADLPNTGVGLELERLVAPIFIRSTAYGTRASSVVTLSKGAPPTFVEESWAPDGSRTGRATA
jgi:uncharacterized protein with NRDE domain